MQKGELKFMINKLCNVFADTIQVKQPFLLEIMRKIDNKILEQFKDNFIYKKDFVNIMNVVFKELNDRLVEVTHKCDTFSLQVIQDRLPEYLQPGNHFLGQYKIEKLLSMREISKGNMMRFSSVFEPEDALL